MLCISFKRNISPRGMRNGKKSSWNSAFGQGITFRFAKMKTKNSGGEVSDKEWKARDSLLILSITTAVVVALRYVDTYVVVAFAFCNDTRVTVLRCYRRDE